MEHGRASRDHAPSGRQHRPGLSPCEAVDNCKKSPFHEDSEFLQLPTAVAPKVAGRSPDLVNARKLRVDQV